MQYVSLMLNRVTLIMINMFITASLQDMDISAHGTDLTFPCVFEGGHYYSSANTPTVVLM